MVTHGAKRKTLALAVAGALLGTGFMAAPEAKAEGFVDDSSLTGGIYYWQRQRDRKDLTPGSAEYGKYVANLRKPLMLSRLRVMICGRLISSMAQKTKLMAASKMLMTSMTVLPGCKH